VSGELLRFCLVGTVGFVVDSGLTMMFTQFFGVIPVTARIIAFIVAASVTFLLNRQFTFRSTVGAIAWLRYLVLTALGALINVGVYLLWLWHAGHAPIHIFLGVAIGSICALAFNFIFSRRFVFCLP